MESAMLNPKVMVDYRISGDFWHDDQNTHKVKKNS